MITLTPCFKPIPVEGIACPICGKRLFVVGCDAWESETGEPVELSIECETEPDIDSDEWDPWFDTHYRMPYVHWLPIEEPIRKWFAARYRIDTQEARQP